MLREVFVGIAAIRLFLAVLLWFPAACGATDAQWITLGTAGGPPLHASTAQIANALQVGEAVYLFDAGNGLLRQMDAAGLAVRNLRAVFLSHHHPDHNADVGPVMLAWWLIGSGEPLPILGPRGTGELVEGLVAANAATVLASFPIEGTRPKPALGAVVRASNLPPRLDSPSVVYQDEHIRVLAIDVDHFQVPPAVPMSEHPQAVAYRVEVAGRSYVYSGDTGPSKKLQTLADHADVLVTEVVNLAAIRAMLVRSLPGAPSSVIDGYVAGMARNHLTPQAIGEIAGAAQVRQVVLTHFVPALADSGDPAGFTSGIAPGYVGPVTLARDLDRF